MTIWMNCDGYIPECLATAHACSSQQISMPIFPEKEHTLLSKAIAPGVATKPRVEHGEKSPEFPPGLK
jgi:hypothetical protein